MRWTLGLYPAGRSSTQSQTDEGQDVGTLRAAETSIRVPASSGLRRARNAHPRIGRQARPAPQSLYDRLDLQGQGPETSDKPGNKRRDTQKSAPFASVSSPGLGAGRHVDVSSYHGFQPWSQGLIRFGGAVGPPRVVGRSGQEQTQYP